MAGARQPAVHRWPTASGNRSMSADVIDARSGHRHNRIDQARCAMFIGGGIVGER